jgi:hypothetical protein
MFVVAQRVRFLRRAKGNRRFFCETQQGVRRVISDPFRTELCAWVKAGFSWLQERLQTRLWLIERTWA